MDGSYDRKFSIGMLEHMKNYQDRLKKIPNWMKSDGLLFVHRFCHKVFAYHFEHMKNYQDLLKKTPNWMKSDGLLFVHHFWHKAFAYHFEDVNDNDWIARYFFTGGTMPSANLLLYFQDDVSVVNHWLVDGKHYAQMSEEWLKRMDGNLGSIRPIMESTHVKDSATKWTVY